MVKFFQWFNIARRDGDLTNDLRNYYVNDGSKAIFVILFILGNIACFVTKFLLYTYEAKHADAFALLGYSLPSARGAAEALKLNCSLIILMVLRNFLSWLRTTPLARFLPLDKNIVFHRAIGWAIVFWSMVHALSHFFNYMKLAKATTSTIYDLQFFTVPGATGFALSVVLIVLVSAAVTGVRRENGMFETFWYSHHLFIIFYGLLIAHGFPGVFEPPQFWAWFLLPGLMYIIERGLRIIRGNKDTILLRAIQHPSRVLELQLSKSDVKYKAGQYIFLNCPYLASQEWHPFTITSAPEDDYMSVHIRLAGDWTGQLHQMFNPNKKLGVVQEELRTAPNGKTILRVDGPFGTASEQVFDFATVMLIGAGIGVTPFASILRSIRWQIETQTKRRTRNFDQTPIKKVYFFWISRDKAAFEWFSELLQSLEQSNVNKFLEIRVFLTGQLTPTEIKALMTGADLTQTTDALTGLEASTEFGRPDWKNIFGQVKAAHAGSEVGVFFCGPSVLSKALYKVCTKFTDTSTRFKYHKENF